MTNAVVKQECTQVCVGMSSPEKSSPEKPTMKERILETAGRLFYLQGIRAVGVDTIAAEIGISKRTLSNHFPSKDEWFPAFSPPPFLHPRPSTQPPPDHIPRTSHLLHRHSP